MPNEIDFNELIELYSVLEQLEPPFDGPLPLRIPDELFAEEYYWLGWRYSKNYWIHHAFECLKRAESLDDDERERVAHLRRTKLPSVIPSVEAVELNLLARNAHRRSFGGELAADSSSREIAYSLAQRCVERHSKFESGYITLGELEIEREDFRGALRCYEKVYALNPNYIDAIVAIGNVWLKRVKLLRAKSWFEKALELDPKNLDAISALYNIKSLLRHPSTLLYQKYEWLGPVVTRYHKFKLERSLRRLKKQSKANPKMFVREKSGVIDKTGKFLFETDDVVYRDLLDDLVIIIGVDQPNGTSMLSREDRDKFDCDILALVQTAFANLNRMIRGQAALKGLGNGVFMISAGGTYESSLVLIETFLESVAAHVDGQLVFSIPARDVVFVTGSNSAESLQLLQKFSDQIFAKNQHSISRELYTIEQGELKKFLGA